MKTPAVQAALTAFAIVGVVLTGPVSARTEPPGLSREAVMAEYWRAHAAGELPNAAQVHGPLLSQALAQSMGSHGGRGRPANLPPRTAVETR